jgi:hypothetical protein
LILLNAELLKSPFFDFFDSLPTDRQNDPPEKIADIRHIHNIAQGLYILNISVLWDYRLYLTQPRLNVYKTIKNNSDFLLKLN